MEKNNINNGIVLSETSNQKRNQSAKEKLKFNDTIIEITNNNECKINDLISEKQTEYNYGDGEITESEFPIRDEIDNQYNDELVKKRIYKQALNINQVSIVSPKFQRIHEGVSRVFGLDDPPPGFGLIYPKYYYLEQKRPQPMSPLKVWRGFNGNIYFEPIQLKNLDINNTHDYSRHTLNHNNSNKISNKSDILDTESERLTASSKFIDFTKEDTNVSDLEHQQFKIDVLTKTTSNNNRDTTQLLLEEASELLLANTISKRSQTFFQINSSKQNELLDNDLDTMSTTSMNAVRKQTKLNSLVLKRNDQTTKSDHSKLKISNIDNPQRILPNLAAVKRHNVPLRGLAYREAKQRINSSNDYDIDFQQQQQQQQQLQSQQQQQQMPISNYDYFNKNKATPEELFRQTNSTANSSYLRADSPHKINYRDMLKGIRKGVTVNLSTSLMNSMRKDDLNALNDETNSNTTNSTNNNSNNKKISLKENLNPKLLAIESKKSKQSTAALITHRNFKILNIKGDRISNIDILLPKPAINTEIINSNPANSSMTMNTNSNTNNLVSTPSTVANLNSSSNHNILTEKSRTDMNPNKINKIVIKAKIQSPSMMSLKSNISLVSIQPASRRANPSPEMT